MSILLCENCGHDRYLHIYAELQCRPGFVCPCEKFQGETMTEAERIDKALANLRDALGLLRPVDCAVIDPRLELNLQVLITEIREAATRRSSDGF